MKPRSPIRLGPIVLAAAVMLTACGDSADTDGVSETSYFEAFADMVAVFDGAVDGLPEAGADSSLDDVRARFEGTSAALEEAAEAAGALSVPAIAEAGHNEFVSDLDELLELNSRVADRASELESAEDLQALAGDPELGIANYNAVAAQVLDRCEDLQAVANDNDLDINIACQDLDPGN